MKFFSGFIGNAKQKQGHKHRKLKNKNTLEPSLYECYECGILNWQPAQPKNNHTYTMQLIAVM